MASTSLIVKSTKNGVSEQKSVTYVNPAATNANLKTFAQKITAISNHTYTGATRVDKTDVNEAGGGSKLEPTLTVSDGSYAYNGDGQIFGYVEDDYCLKINRTNKTFSVKTTEGSTVSTYTIHLHATEGTNYAAKSITFSYSAS